MKMDFGNMKKKVKEAFGKQDPIEMTQTEEKKKAAQIREASENLRNKLAAVRFVDPTGKISKEDLTTYQHMISIVMYNLESAGASLLDTRRMDREMLGLADYLNSAIHSGKAATVKYIVQALMYGVGKGHKALLVDEVPKTKEILIEREKRLEKYKTIVGLSQQIDDLQQSIDNQQKKAEEKSEEFKEKQRKLEDELDENPHLEEQLEEYGGDSPKLSPQAAILATKMKNVTSLFDHIQALKKQIALDYGQIVSLEQTISNEELGLSELSKALSQEIKDLYTLHEEEYRQHLVEQKKDLKELEDLSHRFSDAVAEIFDSSEMKEYIIDAQMGYERVLQELDEEAKGKERGRQRRREREQERKQKQEQEAKKTIDN